MYVAKGIQFSQGGQPEKPARSAGPRAASGSRCGTMASGRDCGARRAGFAVTHPIPLIRSRAARGRNHRRTSRLGENEVFGLDVGRNGPTVQNSVFFGRRAHVVGKMRRKKPPPVPCLALLRTRIVQWAPQVRGSDPTTEVGLQAPDSLLAPRGYSIGSSKVSPLSRTPQRFMGRLPVPRPHSTTPPGGL